MNSSTLLTAAGMVAESIIKPLRPKGDGWREAPVPIMPGHNSVVARFCHPAGFNVLSAVESVTEDHGTHLDYHISMTKFVPGKRDPKRCTSNEAAHILKCFEVEGWEEDNHVPGGVARNFWRPVVENDVGQVCPCKATEPAIREDKGDFVWRPSTEH